MNDADNYIPLKLPPQFEKERAETVAKGKVTMKDWDWGYKYGQLLVDNLNKNVREGK